MIKTKIDFKEIQPGDLLEVVDKADGVKTVSTGIAFEYDGDYISGYGSWFTSEQGLLVLEDDNTAIYRLNVSEVKFEDLKVGDLIRISFPPIQHSMSRNGDITYERSGVIGYIDPSYGEVLTVGGQRLLSRSDFFENAKVEILERGE